MKTDVWFSIWAAVAGDPSSGRAERQIRAKLRRLWSFWFGILRTLDYDHPGPGHRVNLTVCSPMSLDMDYGIDILFPTFYRSFSFIASSQVTKGIISLYSQGLHSTLLMMVCWRPLQRWCCMQSCSIIVIGGVCFGHYGSFSRLLWLAMVSGTLWTLGGGTQRF